MRAEVVKMHRNGFIRKPPKQSKNFVVSNQAEEEESQHRPMLA
jgi:hypothetical protein